MKKLKRYLILRFNKNGNFTLTLLEMQSKFRFGKQYSLHLQKM